MLASVRPALVLLVAFTALCGLAYPLAVTAVAQLVLPQQANGSLVERGGVTVGSSLIGQHTTDPRLFWGRPSSTGPAPYNAMASSGSNLGPTNPALISAMTHRIEALHQADIAAGVTRDVADGAVPVDLVTASASGLDPDISPRAAQWQVPRVARARGIDAAELQALVQTHVVPRTVGIWGEERVNVLLLNLALDTMDTR